MNFSKSLHIFFKRTRELINIPQKSWNCCSRNIHFSSYYLIKGSIQNSWGINITKNIYHLIAILHTSLLLVKLYKETAAAVNEILALNRKCTRPCLRRITATWKECKLFISCTVDSQCALCCYGAQPLARRLQNSSDFPNRNSFYRTNITWIFSLYLLLQRKALRRKDKKRNRKNTF